MRGIQEARLRRRGAPLLTLGALMVLALLTGCNSSSNNSSSTSTGVSATAPKYGGTKPPGTTALTAGLANPSTVASGIVDGWSFTATAAQTLLSLWGLSGQQAFTWGIFSDAAYTNQITACVVGHFPGGSSSRPNDCLIVTSNGQVIYIAVTDTVSGTTAYNITANSIADDTTAYLGSSNSVGSPQFPCYTTIGAPPGGGAIFDGIPANGSRFYQYGNGPGPCSSATVFSSSAVAVSLTGIGNAGSSLTFSVYSDNAFTAADPCSGGYQTAGNAPQWCPVVRGASQPISVKVTETAGQSTQYMLSAY